MLIEDQEALKNKYERGALYSESYSKPDATHMWVYGREVEVTPEDKNRHLALKAGKSKMENTFAEQLRAALPEEALRQIEDKAEQAGLSRERAIPLMAKNVEMDVLMSERAKGNYEPSHIAGESGHGLIGKVNKPKTGRTGHE